MPTAMDAVGCMVAWCLSSKESAMAEVMRVLLITCPREYAEAMQILKTHQIEKEEARCYGGREFSLHRPEGAMGGEPSSELRCILPIPHCSCIAFRTRCLGKQSAVLCGHIIAAILWSLHQQEGSGPSLLGAG